VKISNSCHQEGLDINDWTPVRLALKATGQFVTGCLPTKASLQVEYGGQLSNAQILVARLPRIK